MEVQSFRVSLTLDYARVSHANNSKMEDVLNPMYAQLANLDTQIAEEVEMIANNKAQVITATISTGAIMMKSRRRTKRI